MIYVLSTLSCTTDVYLHVSLENLEFHLAPLEKEFRSNDIVKSMFLKKQKQNKCGHSFSHMGDQGKTGIIPGLRWVEVENIMKTGESGLLGEEKQTSYRSPPPREHSICVQTAPLACPALWSAGGAGLGTRKQRQDAFECISHGQWGASIAMMTKASKEP